LREELAEHVSLTPVCPELEIGLGVPRDPIRMVARPREIALVQPSTGHDLTHAMRAFSSHYLGLLGAVDGFILKGRSPSCGIRGVNVYRAPASRDVVSAAAGRFAAAVLERFPEVAVEDEGRLNDLQLREHFLTRIFISANLRAALDSGAPAELVRFHARNKLLLLAYSEAGLRRLGRIVADAGRGRLETIGSCYRAELAEALARPPRLSAHINVVLHALGHVSRGVRASEKAQFLDSVAAFRCGRLPVSALQEVLRSWSARFENHYLANQTYLAPFPPELVRLGRPGRRRRIAR
jgi:uncharacterized protein YbgA (DUF1722 family)/uncharacterized protein YbbK (DUF523 family)